MSILTETALISISMMSLCILPFYIQNLRRYSKFFYLLGTGALAGILFFDLIPDLFEMGGIHTLWGVAAVWLLYSLLHLYHLKYHKPLSHSSIAESIENSFGHSHGQSISFFMASMFAHCLASGMLLVISEGYAGSITKTLFWALFAHKAYESLTVSSVLLEKKTSPKSFFIAISLYSISMPLGVLLTLLFKKSVTENIAFLVTSLAAGTLLGCLIFDFLLPSFHSSRSRKHALTWIAVGLCMTQVFLKFT